MIILCIIFLYEIQMTHLNDRNLAIQNAQKEKEKNYGKIYLPSPQREEFQIIFNKVGSLRIPYYSAILSLSPSLSQSLSLSIYLPHSLSLSLSLSLSFFYFLCLCLSPCLGFLHSLCLPHLLWKTLEYILSYTIFHLIILIFF